MLLLLFNSALDLQVSITEKNIKYFFLFHINFGNCHFLLTGCCFSNQSFEIQFNLRSLIAFQFLFNRIHFKVNVIWIFKF